MRPRHWLVAVLALAGSVGSLAMPESASAVGETGRVTLTTPVRLIDTRSGAKISSSTPLPSGLLMVTVLGSTTEGSADVVACGQPADASPTFRFNAGSFVSRSLVVDAGMCLVPSTPIHVMADKHGDVDVPSVGALQYTPLATPVELFSGLVANEANTSSTQQLTWPSGLAPAAGSVLRIDTLGDTGGFATLAACGSGGAAGSYSSVVVTDEVSTGVEWTDVGPGESLCLFVYGPAIVEVSLVGTLDTTGSDPTRLPPGTASVLGSFAPPGFEPVSPYRVLDTRSGDKLLAGEIGSLDLSSDVGFSAEAVTLNVTITAPDDDGYLTVWPCDQDQPTTSNLNFVAGQNVANLVNVALAADSTVCFFSSADTHVLADIAGSYVGDGGAAATAMSPRRLLDTRNALGVDTRTAVAAGGVVELTVVGRETIPASGVTAVTMNVTVVAPTAEGYLTVWPCGEQRPEASNVNFVAGVDVANLVTVKVPASGKVCLYTTAPAHLLADAAQWFSSSSSSGYMALTPDRLLDTRQLGGKIPADSRYEVQVAGLKGVPASGATSVTMNVTEVAPEGDGYLSVWPCDEAQPTVSSLNFKKGHNVPNLVTVKLSAEGKVCFASTAKAHLLADVAGYSTTTPISAWQIVVA